MSIIAYGLQEPLFKKEHSIVKYPNIATNMMGFVNLILQPVVQTTEFFCSVSVKQSRSEFFSTSLECFTPSSIEAIQTIWDSAWTATRKIWLASNSTVQCTHFKELWSMFPKLFEEKTKFQLQIYSILCSCNIFNCILKVFDTFLFITRNIKGLINLIFSKNVL